MAKHVMVASQGHSGTLSMALFGRDVLGIMGRHQNFRFINSDAKVHSYDLFDMPPYTANWTRKVLAELPEDETTLDADWTLSMAMYAINKERPDIEWIVLMRDPLAQANSLMHFRGLPKTPGPKDKDLRYYINLWLRTYEFIAEQAERMDPKPWLYDFGGWTDGLYVDHLCGLLGVEVTPEIRARAMAHLVKKTNARGDYKPLDAPKSSLWPVCMELTYCLTQVCRMPLGDESRRAEPVQVAEPKPTPMATHTVGKTEVTHTASENTVFERRMVEAKAEPHPIEKMIGSVVNPNLQVHEQLIEWIDKGPTRDWAAMGWDFDAWYVAGNRRLSRGDAELLRDCCFKIGAKRVLEVGSADGTSTLVLGWCMKQLGGHLWCIEPQVKGRWRENVAKWNLGQYVTMMQGKSPDMFFSPECPTELDLAFCDGLHETDQTIVDGYCAWDKLRVGGISVFHDFCGASGYQAKVRAAIDELAKRRKWTEVGRAEGKDKGAISFRKDA